MSALCRQGHRVVAVDSCAGDAPANLPGVTYPLASKDELESLRDEFPDQVLTVVADVRDRAALGVWNTAAACVPHMLTGPDPSGCRFVAVASAAGSCGLFHLTGYNMVKHAVIGLVRGLAADLTGTGVAAIAVSPGSTRTEMLAATAALYELDDVEHFTASQLTGRLIDPAEVAETIAFCCSVAGGVLTGSVVSAEGGFRG
ncbi:short-chain dehydrogenase/reductase SDR [Parafrankia sp. EAN1pec]|uniref:SDR family oxidoreductase n=1 Tax=Parafrankia sp. (strain EAN1pec) TaxID=298653 RepID=UPI00015D9D84|nr:short-chain dehydrogenase/reductase SDR [Frankia sp. EAN1pec]